MAVRTVGWWQDLMPGRRFYNADVPEGLREMFAEALVAEKVVRYGEGEYEAADRLIRRLYLMGLDGLTLQETV